jgi:hypothetical protein
MATRKGVFMAGSTQTLNMKAFRTELARQLARRGKTKLPKTDRPKKLGANARRQVERATVRFLRNGGQGVIVPGSFILTAAHCINWELTGGMTLGDYFLEKVECGGREFLASVFAVEPVNDIAVLGEPDNQALSEEADLFQEVMESVQPVPLNLEEFELFEEFPAFIFTHKGNWLKAQAQQCREKSGNFALSSPMQIEGGTSGSPIVDTEGKLLSLVSWASETKGPCRGSGPRPQWALPRWVLERIINAAE